MAALRGGRSTLANQGSLYHASWGPRLPDASEHPAEGGQKPRGAPWDRTADGLSLRVKSNNASPFAS